MYFDNMAISLSQYEVKIRKSRLYVHESLILEITFAALTQGSSVVPNDTQGSREYSTLEMAVGTHFREQHGTKTTLVFLHVDREISWCLLPSSISLLFDGKVQPETTIPISSR